MHAHVDGSTVSLWMATAAIPQHPPLRADTRADVCVVGNGIAGLTTAYRLAAAGHEVVVLDERDLCGGQSARTSGHLCSALDDRFFELESLFGQDGARLAAQSHAAAVDAIEGICRSEEIECGFTRVDGYLVQSPGDLHAGVLDREFEAASRAGLAVDRVPGAPDVLAVFGDALCFHDQARFHVLHYLAGLARAVERLGGRIHGGTRVDEVEGGSDAGVVTANGARVRAGAVVVATNVPFNDRLAIHTKQAAYRTYVVALRIAHDAVPDALLWDTVDPYHYVRISHERNGSWLIVGGEDRKCGQDDAPEAHFVELERWTRDHFPMAGAVGYRWSGQVVEPVDSLAFIGRNPGLARNVYMVSGDSGNGLTHGTIGGLLLADLISGRESPWADLYAPNRRTLRSTGEFLKENANFVPYYGELVTGGDVDRADALAPGQAAILRDGVHKVAAWRDDAGALHLHSAICPHLGCVVHWNPVEHSWDCPCHGSRFDAHDGSRLNGPADRGLAPAHLDQPATPMPPYRTPPRPGVRM
jgi:glycine/D-amino acid oxidase-like deaminating enzyme/nitrite reductase/ring-hydroxylating ferredoxin subunit